MDPFRRRTEEVFASASFIIWPFTVLVAPLRSKRQSRTFDATASKNPTRLCEQPRISPHFILPPARSFLISCLNRNPITFSCHTHWLRRWSCCASLAKPPSLNRIRSCSRCPTALRSTYPLGFAVGPPISGSAPTRMDSVATSREGGGMWFQVLEIGLEAGSPTSLVRGFNLGDDVCIHI